MRYCSECGKPMKEGYVVENGLEYYCSDKCLYKHYTLEEWQEMYDDGNTDNYWTDWYDEEDDDEENVLIEPTWIATMFLRDDYVEKNNVTYDYVIKANLFGTKFTKETLRNELQLYIYDIKTNGYEDCVTTYIDKFFKDRNIQYTITPFNEILTLEY